MKIHDYQDIEQLFLIYETESRKRYKEKEDINPQQKTNEPIYPRSSRIIEQKTKFLLVIRLVMTAKCQIRLSNHKDRELKSPLGCKENCAKTV